MPSAREFPYRHTLPPFRSPSQSSHWICLPCRQARTSAGFSTSSRVRQQQRSEHGPFRIRLRTALRDTKAQWGFIPASLGIAFLGAVQFYRVREREKRRQKEEENATESSKEGDQYGKPSKRKRIRPSGPWYMHPTAAYRSC